MMSKNYQVIKMHFSSGLHISRGKDNNYNRTDLILHSDTIKSALFACAKQLFGDDVTSEFLEATEISSAFPFHRQQLFFPKPMVAKLPLLLKQGETMTSKKLLKNIEYLEHGIYLKLLQGESVSLDTKQLSKDGKFVSPTEINELKIFNSTPFQHVNIGNDPNEESVPFYVDKCYFEEHGGLFFLFRNKTNNEKINAQFGAALHLLSDSGIGTDRSAGNGQFEIEFDFKNDKYKIAFPEPSNGTFWTNLSLYCPDEMSFKQLELTKSGYQVIKRGGFISSPANSDRLTLRKRSIYMFKEGSVLNSKLKPKGKLVDLNPNSSDSENIVEHPIYRDGTSIFLPIAKNLMAL